MTVYTFSCRNDNGFDCMGYCHSKVFLRSENSESWSMSGLRDGKGGGGKEPMLQVFSNLLPWFTGSLSWRMGSSDLIPLVNGSFNGGWEEKYDSEQGGRCTWWQLAKRSPTSPSKWRKKRFTFFLFLPEELSFLKVSVLFYAALKSTNSLIGLANY